MLWIKEEVWQAGNSWTLEVGEDQKVSAVSEVEVAPSLFTHTLEAEAIAFPRAGMLRPSCLLMDTLFFFFPIAFIKLFFH